jgi:hypothetical protein
VPLSDESHDSPIFDWPRRCLREPFVPHPTPIRRPDGVQWDSQLGAIEWHICADGQRGILEMINPPSEATGESFDAGIRGREGPQWPEGGEART